HPAGAAPPVPSARPLERDPPRVARAGARAVAVSAVADPAQEEELLAVRSDTDDQPQRIHALPRSGRGGWTSPRGCAKKGAANRALPGVGFRQRVRGGDSGPAPLSAVGGNGLPQLVASRQPARRQPVTNSALSVDTPGPHPGQPGPEEPITRAQLRPTRRPLVYR